MFKPKLIIFDVNETLLDLVGMNASIAKALGDRDDLLPLWFSTMLHYSLVENAVGNYRGFADIGIDSLTMIAKAVGLQLSEAEARGAIEGPLESLQPHPDVLPALDALSNEDYRLVCLTNSSKRSLEAQLHRSGLAKFFECQFSVERVKKYKPHPEPYQMVLKDVGVQPHEALMVAAHAWDLMGAKKVGMHTAFIARPGKSLYSAATKPDSIARDLLELVPSLQMGNEK